MENWSPEGVCPACQWNEEKKTIDWVNKWKDLERLCDLFRKQEPYNVIVPMSGGKDGSHVAWTMKEKLGMSPLGVTFAPPIWTDIGLRNLVSFTEHTGIPHIMITPNMEVYRAINKRGFIEDGYPKRGFVAGLAPSVSRLALNMGIRFIMWGEHEREYEGRRSCHSEGYQISYDDFLSSDDFCGKDPSFYADQFEHKDYYWWDMPSQERMDEGGLYQTYWSEFEPWDDELHRETAVRECGLEARSSALNTFTTYSQVDDILQDLFMFMAYVKFGFGRCTADLNLEIRNDRMSRKEAVGIAQKMEGVYNWDTHYACRDYFRLNEMEYWNVIVHHVNRDILEIPEEGPVLGIGKPYPLKEEIS